jgi:hypothetical protein
VIKFQQWSGALYRDGKRTPLKEKDLFMKFKIMCLIAALCPMTAQAFEIFQEKEDDGRVLTIAEQAGEAGSFLRLVCFEQKIHLEVIFPIQSSYFKLMTGLSALLLDLSMRLMRQPRYLWAWIGEMSRLPLHNYLLTKWPQVRRLTSVILMCGRRLNAGLSKARAKRSNSFVKNAPR